ncbi:hypothetical protein, partial [Companilactobacillus halodurans]|uniref:hypothetical protein n=1 Tax=Companilactobacillus halodurans TaxID=2584183 RepID=UPI001EE7B344
HSCLIWFGCLNLNTRTVMFFFYLKENKKLALIYSSTPESLEPNKSTWQPFLIPLSISHGYHKVQVDIQNNDDDNNNQIVKHCDDPFSFQKLE